MKAKEIIEIINYYDLYEAEIDDVVGFAKIHIADNKRTIMCGACAKYGHEDCPWPDSRIVSPPCLEFIKKK